MFITYNDIDENKKFIRMKLYVLPEIIIFMIKTFDPK